jgi:hypothetical protein
LIRTDLLPESAPILSIKGYFPMDKQEAFKMLRLFELGAISMASAHLNFDIESDDGLTETQAEKFHKFVKPLLVKTYERVKGDEKKLAEFQSVYLSVAPADLLCYLLKEQFTSQLSQVK